MDYKICVWKVCLAFSRQHVREREEIERKEKEEREGEGERGRRGGRNRRIQINTADCSFLIRGSRRKYPFPPLESWFLLLVFL